MFSLEKLKVYDRALGCVASLTQLSAPWNKRHAVADQLLRASESVILNIVEAARLRGSGKRQHVLDYALGSALECAACLDIAQIKQFVPASEVLDQKKPLCEVVKMLVGLRRSWAEDRLHEDSADYEAEETHLFSHERLQAYRTSLELVDWFHRLAGGPELSSRLFRQIDKASTSVVLNLAESNGRPLNADRGQFLDTAESSVVKVAAYVDLGQRMGELEPAQRAVGIALADQTAILVRGLAGL